MMVFLTQLLLALSGTEDLCERLAGICFLILSIILFIKVNEKQAKRNFLNIFSY